MAHLNLVKIHPCGDGNGRMSRALSTLVFAWEALMPAEFSRSRNGSAIEIISPDARFLRPLHVAGSGTSGAL
jgi:hypothetical protein